MIYLVYAVTLATSLGIYAQCFSNRKTQRAEFMAFPISLLLLFPYPIWTWLSLRVSDNNLLAISFIMGIPSSWLALQYFQYEWPRRNRGLSIEDKITLFLTGIGIIMIPILAGLISLNSALSISAAYYTCCISIFSYLVKIWKVLSGQENLEGLKWSTMILLLVFYACMIYVGKSGGIYMLSFAYMFSVFACLLAILYKFQIEYRSKVQS